jgi:hypothetical protein
MRCLRDAVEYGQHFRPAQLHFSIPKLQVPPVPLLPIFVQINKQIEASVESEFPMFVEIGVDSKFPARKYLMKSSALETGIRDQIRDPGNLAQKLQESDGI